MKKGCRTKHVVANHKQNGDSDLMRLCRTTPMEKSCAQASKKRVRYSRHDMLQQRALRRGAKDATPERAEH